MAASTDHPDLNRDFAEQTVSEAKNGNAEAARDVLEAFADGVDQHSARSWEAIQRTPVYYCQARYLADCFRAILEDGIDPSKALNLVKPAKRPRGIVRVPYDVLSAMFHFLTVHHGFTSSNAKDEIATELHIDPKTVQRAAGEWPLKTETVEVLKSIFKGHAAKMAKILKRRPKRGQKLRA